MFNRQFQKVSKLPLSHFFLSISCYIYAGFPGSFPFYVCLCSAVKKGLQLNCNYIICEKIQTTKKKEKTTFCGRVSQCYVSLFIYCISYLQNAYATYVKEYYIKTFGVSVKTYDQENLKNTVVNGDTSDRLWWFQVCTEVAYFQVAPMNDSIRSSKVDTRHVSYSWKYLTTISLFCLTALFPLV